MMDVLMADHKWARLRAYITGLVNQKFLLQNEHLAAENRILYGQRITPLGSSI